MNEMKENLIKLGVDLNADTNKIIQVLSKNEYEYQVSIITGFWKVWNNMMLNSNLFLKIQIFMKV